MKQLSTLILLFFAFSLLPRLAQAQSGSLEGTVVKRNGNVVTLYTDATEGDAPAAGTKADMSKHFEEKFGNMNMSGWLGVATVEIVRMDKEITEVRIIKEKSEITVNDEKVDHFKVGKRMKIEWPAQVEEPEQSTGQD